MFTTTFRAARLPLSTRAFSVSTRASMAHLNLSGRLGAAPEEVQTNSDRSIVRYAVATTHGRGENKKTSWFKIAAFPEGGQKEFLLSLPKGTLVHVDADARMDSYTDKDGNQRTSLNLIQRSVEVLSRPREPSLLENDEGLVSEAHA